MKAMPKANTSSQYVKLPGAYRLGLLAVMVLWLSACSTLVLQPQMRACRFPDSSATSAPSWVCDARLDGVALSAVGAAPASAGAYSERKAQAIAQARRSLIVQARDDLLARVTAYAQRQAATVPGEEARIVYSLRRHLRSDALSGARVYRTAESPGGALYVLLGLDEQAARIRLRDALAASISADAALWQRYLPGTPLAGLAERIMAAP